MGYENNSSVINVTLKISKRICSKRISLEPGMAVVLEDYVRLEINVLLYYN